MFTRGKRVTLFTSGPVRWVSLKLRDAKKTAYNANKYSSVEGLAHLGNGIHDSIKMPRNQVHNVGKLQKRSTEWKKTV